MVWVEEDRAGKSRRDLGVRASRGRVRVHRVLGVQGARGEGPSVPQTLLAIMGLGRPRLDRNQGWAMDQVRRIMVVGMVGEEGMK